MTLTGLYTNKVYSFRYKVKNKHGWSDYSAVSQFITANVPLAPSAPTITISQTNPTSVDVRWQAPDSGGNPITSYSILFQQKDLATFSDL